MSMKDIDNEDATKANITRGTVYTIQTAQIHTNKYIKYDPSKLTTTVMREIVCECILATEFLRRREHEPSFSRTFIILIVLEYKKARQSR